MADAAHAIPASVLIREGSGFGFVRPGVQVTPFASGQQLVRDWHGHNIREYEIDPAIFVSGDTTLEEWEAFLHHVGAGAGYIVEPVSGTHYDLLCGGLGDGSKTTFPIPVITPADEFVMVDGAPTTAYTLRSSANLVNESYAVPTTTTPYEIGKGAGGDPSISIEDGLHFDQLSCLKVDPDTDTTLPAVRVGPTYAPAVTAAREYTAVVAVLSTADYDFQPRILWYDSTPSYLNIENGSTTSVTAGQWTVLSVTGTAVASSAYGLPDVRINEGGTGFGDYYVGAFALVPGDYTRWHLPSLAPGLIEFDSAPASGARITATATGKRVTRCRLDPGSRWTLTSLGHAAARSIRATEWVEF